jgi:4-hydroxyphenylacetate 3-monooxygenase
MPARTGEQYLEGLRAAKRELWIGGERVDDVTTHPAFRNGARTIAALYDLQWHPSLRDEMLYPSPDSGEPVGVSFMAPHGMDDLARRRRMFKTWADATCGMLGRSPDFLNTNLMAFAAGSAHFGRGGEQFAENMRRYYRYAREHDLCLTHTLINPQANRAVGAAAQADPFLTAGVVRETDAGIIIRGARMLATLAPYSDEIAVFPSTVLRASAEDARYAFAFAIPSSTPGMRYICRDSFDQGRSHFDHPLGSRYEEMDAVVVFEDVLVPWERVFIYNNVELCNGLWAGSGGGAHIMHQFVTKFVAKTEFILGLACAISEMIGIDGFQHVQEKLAEIILTLETIKALLRAAEADAEIQPNGVAYPATMPLLTARNLYPRLYPRMIEILQLLGASGLMATPSEQDVVGPLSGDVERYFQAAKAGGGERVRLFRLAWDVACSSFGTRQLLYERFFSGDPVRQMTNLYLSYPHQDLIDRVQRFLHSDEHAIVPVDAMV